MKNEDDQPIGEKFHLSTEGYYFVYRPDKYDNTLKRATLYEIKTGKAVNDVRVSAHELGMKAKSHFDVINYFESELFLKQQSGK